MVEVGGTYDISLDTPLGVQRGALVLTAAANGALTGQFSAMGKRHAVQGEVVGEGPCGQALVRFSGTLSVLFRTIAFACEASIGVDDIVSGQVEAEGGHFKLEGSKR